MDTASVYSPLDKKDITLAEWYSPFDGGGGGEGCGCMVVHRCSALAPSRSQGE